MAEIIGGLVLFFMIFASVLFLARVSTKYIGEKTGAAAKGKYIKLIESTSLGMDKHLHLIKVGSEYFVVSTNGKNMQFLTKVKIEDTDLQDNDRVEASNVQPSGFKEIFDQYVGAIKPKSWFGKTKKQFEKNSNGVEEFNNNLERLKKITSRIGDKED